MRPAALALCLAALLPALAAADDQSPLTAEAFDALTRGRVFSTWSGGSVYGIEKFLPGGRSIWEDAEGCMYGTWKQVGAQICFLYEDHPDREVCWTYFDLGDRISGYYQGDPAAEPIYLTPDNPPMHCPDWLGA